MVNEILEMARRRDSDSAALVIAMADVLGIIAAVLDRETGYTPLRERLQSFADRAHETYFRRTQDFAKAS